MPTNLYGIGDNYNLQDSHVLPAMIRKFHDAKEAGLNEVVVWGSGRPMREFLFAGDAADACIFLMTNYNDAGFINIGTGKDITIAQLAQLVAEVVGFGGEIVYDAGKPDGTPRKLMDVTKLNNMGWRYTIELKQGIALAYADFVENHNQMETV